MALFVPASFFRPLLIAATSAMLLVAGAASADPQPRHRGKEHARGYNYTIARGHHIRRDHNLRNYPQSHYYHASHYHRPRNNVVVNFNTRPYWYGSRTSYYHRPALFYSSSYPTHYVSYTTFRPMMMTPAAYQVFEYTQPHTPVAMSANNYRYTLTPGQVTDAGNGRYCREYQAVVTINNRLQDSYGQACRQPDGSWEIIS